MNDLGYIPPAPKQTLGATPVTIVSEQDAEQKPQYPTVSFNGEQAAKAGLSKCAHGDVYEITVRLKAKRIGGWDYPGGGDNGDKPPMEFDVISSDEPTEVESPEEDDAEGGEEEEKKTVPPPKSKILSPRNLPGAKEAFDEGD